VRGRRQQRVLVDVGLGAVAVNPDRRRVHDPLDVRLAARLEHCDRAGSVDPLGNGRIGVDIVDVGNGRQVCDRVAPCQRVAQRILVADRADHRLDRFDPSHPGMPRRRPQVVDDRLVAAVGQLVDDVGADEPGSPGN